MKDPTKVDIYHKKKCIIRVLVVDEYIYIFFFKFDVLHYNYTEIICLVSMTGELDVLHRIDILI